MPDLIDLRALVARFEAIVALFPPTDGPDPEPDVLREALFVSRGVQEVLGECPGHPWATRANEWFRIHGLPHDPKAVALDRAAIVGFARLHYQDPVGFHEAVMGALAIDEAEYQPFMTVRVPSHLWDGLRAADSYESVVHAAKDVLAAAEVLTDG